MICQTDHHERHALPAGAPAAHRPGRMEYVRALRPSAATAGAGLFPDRRLEVPAPPKPSEPEPEVPDEEPVPRPPAPAPRPAEPVPSP